jgi:predicted RNA-binding protein with PIN domain
MYLIDGHNLIGQRLIPGIHLEQEDDEARLVMWLRARQPNLRRKMVVIFDGGIPGGTSLALSGSGVTAIFAAHRRSNADKIILARVREAMPAANLTVVTNDGVLRQAVGSLGAQVMRGDEFIRRLQQPARGRAVGSASPKVEPKLSKREVDEWMQMFGAGDDERD